MADPAAGFRAPPNENRLPPPNAHWRQTRLRSLIASAPWRIFEFVILYFFFCTEGPIWALYASSDQWRRSSYRNGSLPTKIGVILHDTGTVADKGRLHCNRRVQVLVN